MKTVILAGGYGTRFSEESIYRPKPMIEIGGMPILWHIMKQYSYYGFNDFVVCAGYKQAYIKEWFANYYLHTSDITFDFSDNGKMIVHNSMSEPWKVTIVDTGLDTMTGGRVKRIQKYITEDEFMLTYGDGVSDINIQQLLDYHHQMDKKVTLTAVNSPQRFGVLDINNNSEIVSFREKSDNDSSKINAGYMVCNRGVFDYIEGDSTVFEKEPLERLASEGQLEAYKFNGFWHSMDTQRDKIRLEKMWADHNAPWKVWD
jgi:glucose-1-phosphate cytidylyltransferase